VLARDGREALAAISERDFDLVLMDIQMPEMDVYGAIQLRSGSGNRPPDGG